jgi:hypothetical protein
MSRSISRRTFGAAATGVVVASAANLSADDDKKKTEPPKGPTEAPFQRSYEAPKFNPRWRRPQINRVMVQDFVIYAHSELDMVKKLLEKEPALINSYMDWGAGDWESGLGGASHMGRRDIVELLLEKGARVDLFCAAMLGQIDVIRSLLTLQPKLIDAKGPHGITLHVHAVMGGKESAPVLDYLQSIKKIDLSNDPFVKMKAAEGKKAKQVPPVDRPRGDNGGSRG